VQTYLIKRLIMVIPTIFLVTVLVFLSVRLIPGDVIDIMVSEMLGGGMTGTAGTSAGSTTTGSIGVIDREAVEHKLGLDVPIYVQYGRWMGNIVLHGDLGNSIWKPTSVWYEVRRRLPVSIELGVIGIIIGLMIALPIGIWSAIRQDSISDYIGRTIAIGFVAIPGFWIGTMIMVYPATWWNWSPPMMYIPLTEDPLGNLGMMIIPAFLLGMALGGGTMRLTRTMMLEVLRQDYIRTAWSKGLKERIVILRHAVRNAIIPVITIVGMQVPILIGGTVIIEQIFNLPGIGRLSIEAIGRRDYPIVSGLNLLIGSFVLLCNITVDMTYGYLDPRVRYK